MVGNAWYQADLVTYYEIHNIIYCIFIIGGESRTVIPYSLWKDIIYYRLIVGGGGERQRPQRWRKLCLDAASLATPLNAHRDHRLTL